MGGRLATVPLELDIISNSKGGFLGGASDKAPACQHGRRETWVRSQGGEDPLKEGVATHSIFLAGESPWTEDLGRLQS